MWCVSCSVFRRKQFSSLAGFISRTWTRQKCLRANLRGSLNLLTTSTTWRKERSTKLQFLIIYTWNLLLWIQYWSNFIRSWSLLLCYSALFHWRWLKFQICHRLNYSCRPRKKEFGKKNFGWMNMWCDIIKPKRCQLLRVFLVPYGLESTPIRLQ